MRLLRIDSVRARLTFYYVIALGVALVFVGGLIYILLARALYTLIDDNLDALIQTADNSLRNDLAEGQSIEDAARSTAAELASRLQMLVIYDGDGRLLADERRDDELDDPLDVSLPPLDEIPSAHVLYVTRAEEGDEDDRHRLGIRRLTISPGVPYVVMAGSSLEPTDEELEALRRILFYVGPLALALAGIGGWFLAHRSLSPVVAMADRARRIGVEDLTARLPVANPDDELGRLALTFNELLGRLETSLTQQRQFMADASHELRTPVTTARTAVNVALQRPHRDEPEYRETLAIVERQTVRLSRVVEDMFTLARADAGNYPARRDAMYLEELAEEMVKAARVVASTKDVEVTFEPAPSSPFVGDEDLLRRLIGNLLDNAVRHTPPGGTVDLALRTTASSYEFVVHDTGPGVPPEDQPHIFERFFRADRSRSRDLGDGGAGLGLSLARWIARQHGGDVRLTTSSAAGSTFTVQLPR
jgi:heavy metal sensor kinase